MTPGVYERPVLDEERWNAWVAKGKRHDEAVTRKFRIFAGILIPLIIIGIAFYFYGAR